MLAAYAGCGRETLPEPGTETYREVVAGFYRGIAALQTGESIGGEEALERVAELAPGEPAVWANLAVVAMRRSELDVAAERLERARALAPEDARIAYLEGRLAALRGEAAEAAAHYERAVALDPQHARAAYALVRALENEGGAQDRIQAVLASLLEARPDNVAVLLEVAQTAVRRGDRAALDGALERLAATVEDVPPEAEEQLAALREAPPDAPPDALATRVAFLRNALIRLPRVRQDLATVQPAPEVVAELYDRFFRLPSPRPEAAPADTALTLAVNPLNFAGTGWSWAGTIVFNAEADPTMVFASGAVLQPSEGVNLPFPGGVDATPPAPHAVTGVDYDYDFLTDIAAAGAGGFRLFRQMPGERFEDVTATLDLPPGVLGGSYTGVWAADVDMEGDLDLVLAATEGAPVVLQNDGDGTFTVRETFSGVEALRGFAWADLDGDGDPDAAVVDGAGDLGIFSNLRGGAFRFSGGVLREAVAVAVTDLGGDAVLDVAALAADGSVHAVSFADTTQSWRTRRLVAWADAPAPLPVAGSVLMAVDLDNNGAVDLVASTPSGGQVWLGTGEEALRASAAFDAHALSVAELTADGRLDLLGVSEAPYPVLLVNRGATSYQWKVLRTRAAQTFGDQRINPFGVGGEMELRAGLLYQKQPITGPITHFGLGQHTEADVARIIWPNGNVQAEFDLTSDEALLANQRLKGSCPWLFTHDGDSVRFVTDFMWRSPLGLAINAQESAGVASAEDWVKIPGELLAPRDGFYDVRITAELWESHYFDALALLVVDHPETTDVFVDERFVIPPPTLAVQATTRPQPLAGVWDDAGRDVAEIVSRRDGRYLGGFELGPYQGVAGDHYVEVALGPEVPVEGPLVLVAQGWVRPTDSSLNVALSQGSHAPPTGLSIEVPDGQGGWRVARAGLGFPAGKTKTVVLPLEGLFTADVPPSERRFRLRTNLEVYWDRLAWARRLDDDAVVRRTRVTPAASELRYRGFSTVSEANRQSPELPHYDRLWTTTQLWRDLEGFYTRFGETTALTADVDDRYVIMNAGDELLLRFAAPEATPPAGWERDYVLIGHAWNKDGDYNTTFSRTVLPLPYHAMTSYDRAPTRLEDDPVYRRHREDWVRYHTRYVTPGRFRGGLTTR